MAPVLDLQEIEAGYGSRPILHHVSLAANVGEVVALVGHNGAGKSTLLKAAVGLLGAYSGVIAVDGQPVHPSPRGMLRLGIAYLPQNRGVFDELTVLENLRLTSLALGLRRRSGYQRIEEALRTVPILASLVRRRAGTLSGGEKQTLALACVLISRPRLLLLDEPTIGLAPPLARSLLERVRILCHEDGKAALVVEQKVNQVLAIADRAYVLRNGEVSFAGAAAALDHDELKASFL